MKTIPMSPSRPSRFRVFAQARAFLAVSALAALALPQRAVAQVSPNAFGATTLVPSSATPAVPFLPLNQSASVGTPFSVNIAFAVSGSQPYGAGFGIDAQIGFDPAKLQVVSVSAAPSSPWTTPISGAPTGFDNVAGTARYAGTGPARSGSAFAVATVVFNPIAAGTSVIRFNNVNEYLVGYGPYGVNGLAVNGSVTVAAALPTQTLTILGGSGNAGDLAANVEYYNPTTGNWQPAYLANYAPFGHPVTHPWGNISGTTRWINYRPLGNSDPGASGSNTLWYLYRVRFTVPSDAIEPKMTFSLKADNRAQVAINGVNTGPIIVGQADQLNADAVFSQAVLPGENTITLNVGDEGGLNGFNFRIDLSMKASQPLEIVPVATDTTAPVIAAPANLVREATGPSGATVTFSATAVDDKDGPVPVVASPASGSLFPLGLTPVGLAAADAAGNTATASFTVTVRDTIAPVVTVPANVTAEATGPGGAAVSYPAATATDLVGVTSLASAPASGSTFPLGHTTVTATAHDAAGNTGSGTFVVTVRDTIAPAIASVTPSTATLWPPNHQMVAINVAAVATDLVGVAALKIVGVTSNEPDNGLGDGDTAGDIQVTGDLTLNLRAERSGGGNGRTYTITVEARDAAGNRTTKTCTVSVPKSQGKK